MFLRVCATRSHFATRRNAVRAMCTSQSGQQQGGSSNFAKIIGVGGGLGLAAVGSYIVFGNNEVNGDSGVAKPKVAKKEAAAKTAAKTYPVMTLDQVRADHGKDTWVTLNGGVYNATPFIPAHPGGESRIEMVNGQDLKPFWDVYSDVHSRPHIRNLLEEYRIGTLTEEDAKQSLKDTNFHDYYKNDPSRPRRKEVLVSSDHPWNHETQPEDLIKSYFTPNELFFVRNHNAVPEVDENDWSLEICANTALGVKTKKYTLKELKEKFQAHSVVAALQCAGNRQEDFVTPDRPLYVAPHWRNGAIGNALWVGVKVRDILKDCGMEVDEMALGKRGTNGQKIVNFIAEDTDETGVPYAGVIPVEKVIDPFGDAILAYTMNGEVLPKDHGYPVRLLAPGHAGCRNVKWVSQIQITAEPSELDSGSRLDRHFAPDISWDEHKDHVKPGGPKDSCKVRVDQGPVIQTLPVQSVISTPIDHSRISGNDEFVTVSGVAWGGAGRGICRVELSIDDGETWSAADLHAPPKNVKFDQHPMPTPIPEAGMGRNWAWTQFSKQVPLTADMKKKLKNGEEVPIKIYTKAVDGDFNSQPKNMMDTWNVLGICINHWAHTDVTLDPKLKKGETGPRPKQPPPGSCVWPGSGKPDGYVRNGDN